MFFRPLICPMGEWRAKFQYSVTPQKKKTNFTIHQMATYKSEISGGGRCAPSHTNPEDAGGGGRLLAGDTKLVLHEREKTDPNPHKKKPRVCDVESTISCLQDVYAWRGGTAELLQSQ